MVSERYKVRILNLKKMIGRLEGRFAINGLDRHIIRFVSCKEDYDGILGMILNDHLTGRFEDLPYFEVKKCEAPITNLINQGLLDGKTREIDLYLMFERAIDRGFTNVTTTKAAKEKERLKLNLLWALHSCYSVLHFEEAMDD